MKKITLLAVLLFSITMMASAQNSKRTTAYNYLRKGKLDLAKENIDPAVVHPKTMEDAKTWFYYGNIYIQIATSQLKAYKDLDPDALNKAYIGYNNCMKYDENDRYKAEILQNMIVISNNYYSKGLGFYEHQEFKSAYQEFSQAVVVNKSIGNVDTLAIYASAMTALAGEMYPEAKTLYVELIEMGYNNHTIYTDLANIYKHNDNIPMATEVLNQGIAKFPNEASLLFAQINILLEEKQYEQVITTLNKAIELAPENHTLYFVQGQSYENMDQNDEAIKSYLKAIEIKADYSDALFNLGAIHYNKAVEIYAQANDLPLDAADKYKEMTENAKKDFLEAQPYFERALVLLPDDANLKSSLKQIYSKTGQLDKVKDLNN